jgi:methylmalonyl-CoA/ethylmalonyl-CoA epimerase
MDLTRRDPGFKSIDHIALAVRELEPAITFFTEVLGFTLVRRRHISGRTTGMLSAELEYHQIKFVLCQGTEPESQVSRLIENYGPGVGHIAIAVDDVAGKVAELKERGMRFDTGVIEGPGLTQAFTSRDANTGMCFEFIQRTAEEGFLEENIQKPFSELEKSGAY